MESIGIRELRQRASQVIEAAEAGAVYRVTNHGHDTGVTISRSPSVEVESGPAGATPQQVIAAGLYDRPRPVGYEQSLLAMVEQGRDRSGRVGDR
jgi:prevent-host-death family protein